MTTFRVLVTGSRTWTHPAHIQTELDAAFDAMLYAWRTTGVTYDEFVVVHGDCPRGADHLADRYARAHRWTVERHPADWRRLGRAAGPIRNQHMVDLGADLCLAFLKDHSSGATGCADLAEKAGIPTRRIHDCDCHPGEVTR